MESNSEVVRELSCGSFYLGSLPEGCIQCLKGAKSVLYATSKCGVGCYYCTIPPKTKLQDLISINEIHLIDNRSKIPEFDQIKEEIKNCNSTGIGLTGGDPLQRPNRTLRYIRYLKQEFGSDFHIHLYTSGKYLTDSIMDELVIVGLDEIRIHPKHLKDKVVMEKAVRYKKAYPELTVGFEIPAIVGKQNEIIELIQFADNNGIDFVNLNEFEFTPSNQVILDKKGFIPLKSNAAVVGSSEMIRNIFETIGETITTNLHFCSSRSKDAIQLTNRYKRRAESVARPFESISDVGELEYGRIECMNKKEAEEIKSILKEEFDVPIYLIEIVESLESIYLETSWIIIDEVIGELRTYKPELKASILSRHPVENGPITWLEYI